jgi:AraC-like DNA-binding protein
MLVGKTITPTPLTEERKLKTLIENRTAFNFENCELNIFETYQTSERVLLNFRGVVYTAMLRGKKMVHEAESSSLLAYLPGESFVLPESMPMLIDFPEASNDNPTQCIALEINHDKIRHTLDLLNERYPRLEENGAWQEDWSLYHLQNSQELALTVERLLRLPFEDNPYKEVLADITLQELLVRLLQTQARTWLLQEKKALQNSHRFAAVMHYIEQHLQDNISVQQLANLACMSKPHFFRSFKQELGQSPLDFIVERRIEHAKSLLKKPATSVSEAAYQSGFNNLTHFSQQFKKSEGLTPSAFKQRQFGRVR